MRVKTIYNSEPEGFFLLLLLLKKKKKSGTTGVTTHLPNELALKMDGAKRATQTRPKG
jgi:hypothetical protein